MWVKVQVGFFLLEFWSGAEWKNMTHTCIVLVPGHSQPWSVPQASCKVVFGRPAVFSIRALGSMLVPKTWRYRFGEYQQCLVNLNLLRFILESYCLVTIRKKLFLDVGDLPNFFPRPCSYLRKYIVVPHLFNVSKNVKGIINLSQVGHPKPKCLTKWRLRFQGNPDGSH